ncbi:MAG TPA: cupin domain-containing protein [Sphingomonadaceae bacterium]|nr:cupin domain-containing protein [Sphingomonadaceae bacterium]
MREARPLALVPLGLLLAACPAAPSHHAPPGYIPPIGSNEIFREATAAAPGHELIVADLRLPPNSVGEPHFHPWEEFLYVIEGSAVLDVDGQEPRVLQAGESFVIPGRTVHTPRAGPGGIRAIIIRLHDEGDPVAIPAGE